MTVEPMMFRSTRDAKGNQDKGQAVRWRFCEHIARQIIFYQTQGRVDDRSVPTVTPETVQNWITDFFVQDAKEQGGK